MTTATQQRQPTQTRTEESPLERVLSATEQAMVRSDLLQMKMENELIMAECRVRPRDFNAIKRTILGQLEAFPDLAVRSIYNKPVGDGKFARGLSIRAAELLAEAYGYNRTSADVTAIDADSVKITATFTDFQTCRIWQDAGILSKWYKARNGGMVRTPEDRFNNVTAKAEVSKRIREVITRSVNAGLKAWYEDECERRIGELLTDDKITEIVNAFKKKGIPPEKLDELVGRPASMGWTKADKTNLSGIWQALQDGEITVQQLLEKRPDDAPAPTSNGPVSAADLANAKKVEEPPPAKPEEPPAPAAAEGKEPEPLQEPANASDFLAEVLDRIKSAKTESEVGDAIARAMAQPTWAVLTAAQQGQVRDAAAKARNGLGAPPARGRKQPQTF